RKGPIVNRRPRSKTFTSKLVPSSRKAGEKGWSTKERGGFLKRIEKIRPS
ncbi:unnamed protein product, partial [Musa textilis]